MSSERTFSYDEELKTLSVRAITEDKFTLEQVKTIYEDLTNKLKSGDEMLKRFKSMKVILLKLQNQPRLKEILEMLVVFIPNIQIPSMENIDKTIKYYKEQNDKLESDIKELKEYYGMTK